MKLTIKHTLCVLGLTATMSVQAENLTFGIVPQQSATKLAALWTPILSYLSNKSGVELSFATAPDIPTFEKRVFDGEYDIAYMNPYHFTFFNEHRGYRSMVRRDDKGIQGIVVVRKDSPIQSLNELQGERIAFPSPAAFAATLLPQGELAKKGISIEPVYVGSHDSVYLSVAGEFFNAGGAIGRTLATTKPEIRDQLRVLWKTEFYTPHAVAAHPRVSDEVRSKITDAFLTMNSDPKGQALLQTLSMESITAAQDSDWDDVRSLKLHLLDSLLK